YWNLAPLSGVLVHPDAGKDRCPRVRLHARVHENKVVPHEIPAVSELLRGICDKEYNGSIRIHVRVSIARAKIESPIRRPVDRPAKNAAINRHAERLNESSLGERGIVVAPYNHRAVYRQCLRRPYDSSHAEIVEVIVGYPGEYVIGLPVLEVEVQRPWIDRP